MSRAKGTETRFQLSGLARAAAALAGTGLIWAHGTAYAQVASPPSPAETCLAANRNLSLGASLPRTTARLKSGAALKIVAIGSSSTVGLWVFRPEATYPGILQKELERMRPTSQIEVINSGRVGDTIPGSISRFDRDVLFYEPDLVIWQLGTNDVAWGGSADGLRDQVVTGVRRLKSSGSDVILMDQQYAHQVFATSQYSRMQNIISDVARQEHVGLISRFELMHRSIEAGLSPTALLSWDGLHHSADGYDCVGRSLARAISNTAEGNSAPKPSYPSARHSSK
jgi:acyl-CoA thioesterase I